MRATAILALIILNIDLQVQELNRNSLEYEAHRALAYPSILHPVAAEPITSDTKMCFATCFDIFSGMIKNE